MHVHVHGKGYAISIGNKRILAITIEKFPLHNLVYIKPIVTTQRNNSHVTKIIPTNYVPWRFIAAKPYIDVHVCLTI